MLLGLTATDGVLTVRAPAKVNLTLRVLGRRRDGYHDLESVVAQIDWCDTLEVRPADALQLSTDGAAVPAGEDNLVMKAARALARAAGVDRGARMMLRKRIPVGRGLGGGSADAAAALAALDALWQCRLDEAALARVAAEVGSDVPLFLGPPVAVMRGRGERIEPVRAACRWWMALVWPDYGLSTAEVYAAYDRLARPAGAGPRATDILEVLGGAARSAAPYLVNDLEPAAHSIRLVYKDLRRMLEEAGAEAVGMTGSGSAYFALADTAEEARAWARAAEEANLSAVVAQVSGPTQQQETPQWKSPTSQ